MSTEAGTIIFKTGADNSELVKQIEEAKEKVKSLEKKQAELSREKEAAAKREARAQEALTAAQDKFVKSEEAAVRASSEAADAKERLLAAQKKLTDMEAQKHAYDELRRGNVTPENAMGAAEFTENYRTGDEWKASLSAAKSEVSALEKELHTAEATAGRLGDKFLEAVSALNTAKNNFAEAQLSVAGIDASLIAAAAEMDSAQENAGNLQNKLKKAEKAAASLKKPIDAADKATKKLGNRILKLAANAFVFTLISKALKAVRDRIGDAIKSNEQAAKSVAMLKGAVLTAIQPIVDVAVPALTTLANMLTRVITLVMRLFGSDFVKNSKEAAKALSDQASGIDEVNDAAKRARNNLAGFDELNILNNNAEATSSDTTDKIAPDFNFDTELSDETTAAADELAAYMAGAFIAIGAVLAFSGANIPLGIGLLAVGAVTMAAEIAENWGAMDEKVSGAIDLVLETLTIGGLVVGAILAFSGANIPLGIGLMLLGASALGTAVATRWDSISKELEGSLGSAMGIIGGALLVIGLVLALSGVGIPLGIALMVLGAASLATAIAPQWDALKKSMEGPVGKLTAFVSGLLMVIGIILLFTGAGIPIGLGFLVVGAVGMVAAIAPNWDTVKQKIQSVFAGILAIISGASLILGVLMCLSGVGIGLGLALIFAGIKGTQAAWSLSDNPVTRFVKDLANGVIEILNSIGEAINDLFHIKFDGLDLFGKNIIPAFETQLLRLPPIPKLAQGAVLPANQPFLAMVGDQKHGTNVEAPLSVIQEAVMLAEEDRVNGMMAGFEALLDEVQRLRAAVEGIEVGDSTIGQAANRYNQRMAVIRG